MDMIKKIDYSLKVSKASAMWNFLQQYLFRKPVLGVCNRVMPKASCVVTAASCNTEIMHVARLNIIILFREQIVKGLIRLADAHGGLPFVFCMQQNQVFLR